MKKLLIPASLFLSTLLFFSCSKESTSPDAARQSTPVSSSSQSVKIVSQWFNPSFNIVNDRGITFLKSYQAYETPLNYDRTTHIELAYIKLTYQGATNTIRLRAILSSPNHFSNKRSEINYALTETGCIVTIKNGDRETASAITANPFPDMQVRYLVIPKILFETLGIDWDDYTAVAQALNI